MELTETNNKTLADYFAALKRYRTRMIAVAAVLLVATIGLALGLPAVYRSTATILIEQQEIPQELVRSMVTSYADERIQVISQRVMTRANLTQIIDKYNLYEKDRKSDPMEEVIEKMRKDIKMNTISADVMDSRNGRPTQATIAFKLSYDNSSPAFAQKVANEMVSLYLNENLKTRAEAASQTTGFLTDEADKVSAQISDLEKKLALFKERNVGQLPELAQLNLQMMDRTDSELLEVERDLRSTMERKTYLEIQLTQIKPNVAVFTNTGERIMGPADRLKHIQTTYLSLASAYGPEHPDVVRARREIEALKAKTQENNASASLEDAAALRERAAIVTNKLADARKKYAADHPDVMRLERELEAVNQTLAQLPAKEVEPVSEPDNPAYIQLQGQLDSARAEIQSFEQKQIKLRAKRKDYEERLASTPQVERQYHELIRDYENASVKYKELKAKQMEAQVGQVLETERKGERFTLIEPPELPQIPVKPSRTAIMLLGVVFSFAGGVGTVAVSETVDATVRGARGIVTLINMPPLASIPYIVTDAERRRDKRRRMAFFAVLIFAVITIVMLVHFFYIPLDVLWYAAQRRLGFN